MPAPIPAFNYLNPSRNQGVRISPPHPQVSARSNGITTCANGAIKSEGGIFEYQNVQQHCDLKLLKELHLKQSNLSSNGSHAASSCSGGGSCSSGDESNNRKGNKGGDKKTSSDGVDHRLGSGGGNGDDNRKNQKEKENKYNNSNNNNNKADSNNNKKTDGRPAHIQPQRRMQQLRHEYYNILDNQVRSKSPLVRKTQLPQPLPNGKKNKSPVQVTTPERKLSPEKQPQHSNNILSKFLNMDIKSPKALKKPLSSASCSSANTRSSSGNSFNSFDSIEQAIILGKNENLEGHSYLGPFNFRQLLRPTQGPTESLRKRKGVVNPSSPPPHQRGKNT